MKLVLKILIATVFAAILLLVLPYQNTLVFDVVAYTFLGGALLTPLDTWRLYTQL